MVYKKEFCWYYWFERHLKFEDRVIRTAQLALIRDQKNDSNKEINKDEEILEEAI